jgi:hypothetical protein
MRSREWNFQPTVRQSAQEKHRDRRCFERWLSFRFLGRLYGAAPLEHLFVIDVAYVVITPEKPLKSIFHGHPFSFTQPPNPGRFGAITKQSRARVSITFRTIPRSLESRGSGEAPASHDRPPRGPPFRHLQFPTSPVPVFSSCLVPSDLAK